MFLFSVFRPLFILVYGELSGAPCERETITFSPRIRHSAIVNSCVMLPDVYVGCCVLRVLRLSTEVFIFPFVSAQTICTNTSIVGGYGELRMWGTKTIPFLFMENALMSRYWR